METLYRFLSGAAAALGALFAPAVPLATCAAVFIGADFVTGAAAGRALARRAGKPWYFESRKAWRTVVKAALVIATIVLAWLIDRCILGLDTPRTARLFAGFTCGVELWSFLENCAQLSDAPLFRRLQRFVGQRIDDVR